MDLSIASTEDLLVELAKRNGGPRCRCQRWKTYVGLYDEDGKTWRCRGCLRAIVRCTCS